MPSKYKAVRTFFDNRWFDSKEEAERWAELLIAQKVGLIRNLERQVPFDLFAHDLKHKEPVKIGQWKADFTYQEVATGRTIVEDKKGQPKDRIWRRTKKIVEACYGLRILET